MELYHGHETYEGRTVRSPAVSKSERSTESETQPQSPNLHTVMKADVRDGAELHDPTFKCVQHRIQMRRGPEQQDLQEDHEAKSNPYLLGIKAGHTDDEATSGCHCHQKDDLRACEGHQESFNQLLRSWRRWFALRPHMG